MPEPSPLSSCVMGSNRGAALVIVGEVVVDSSSLEECVELLSGVILAFGNGVEQ